MAEYSVKVRDVTPEDVPRDLVWDLFLSGLAPWELHWLNARELELHDLFVADQIEIADVERMFSDAFPTI
jgi:hypothetical protein